MQRLVLRNNEVEERKQHVQQFLKIHVLQVNNGTQGFDMVGNNADTAMPDQLLLSETCHRWYTLHTQCCSHTRTKAAHLLFQQI